MADNAAEASWQTTRQTQRGMQRRIVRGHVACNTEAGDGCVGVQFGRRHATAARRIQCDAPPPSRAGAGAAGLVGITDGGSVGGSDGEADGVADRQAHAERAVGGAGAWAVGCEYPSVPALC